MITNYNYDAVRYLAALAAYKDNKAAKKIMKYLSFGRYAESYETLKTNPYSVDTNMYYTLGKIVEQLNSVLPSWNILFQNDDGLDFLCKVLYTPGHTYNKDELDNIIHNCEYAGSSLADLFSNFKMSILLEEED